MEKKVFKLVKTGYDNLAERYRNEKSDTLSKFPLFRKWLSSIDEGPILDLGCGSGYPLLENIPSNTQYIGVDISKAQIELAKNQYPRREFYQAEMLDYCQNQSRNKFKAIIILFSLFHLPRKLHYSLLAEVKRISQSKSPFLLLVPEESHIGSIDKLFSIDMWWSSYSYDYYVEIMRSLGFSGIEKQRKVEIFAGEEEINWYLFGLT